MHPHLITDPNDLMQCIERLSNVPKIALDLEFDKNYHRYGFTLCLLQIHAGETTYLIDPFALADHLSKLFPLLESDDIQKVVFVFGEDLRLLHSLGCFPRNLYDLAVGAALLNYPSGSLSKLLETTLGVQTSKSAQRSDWNQRPLSEEQIAYAAADVAYLLEVQTRIEAELHAQERTSWMQEEMSVLESLRYTETTELVKSSELMELSEVEGHLYQAVARWREEQARQLGLPAFRLIDKEVVRILATQPDYTLDHWSSQRGVFRGLKSYATAKRLRTEVEQAREDALRQGLSYSAPALKAPTPEQSRAARAYRNQLEQYKKQYFKPVQTQLAAQYGEHLATFLLSNKQVEAILRGEWEQVKRYRKEIFLATAASLGLDWELFTSSSFSIQ
jgi:ribonuclease D